MWMRRACALICGLAVCSSTHAAERVRYVLLAQDGKQAGEEVVIHQDDGLTRVHYVYKDNGFGPELEEEYRLAPDGTYGEYRARGTSDYGASVDESFARTGNHATWKSTSERGDKEMAGAALYVPLNGSNEFASVSTAALMQSPGRDMPLIPLGTLKQQMLAEMDVTSGKQSRRVQLVAQSGLGFAPTFVWATGGAHPRLFAQIFPHTLLIEEGWQASGKALAERQRSAEQALLRDMARRLAHPMDGLTVIRDARVFDSEHATLGRPSDVYVLRGRISAVLPAGAPMRGVDHEIDARGRVLLPGLFDMHAHVQRWDEPRNLAAGVTTVRDMGNDNATVQAMLDEIAAGQLLSPQIVPAGLLEGESPHAWRAGFVIGTLPEAKSAIDWYAEHGYPQLKIYNSFPKAILLETIAYAHARGMRVSGHVPAFLRARDVVEDGYDEIQHITHVLLNFLVTPTTDTRSTARFILPAQGVAGLDFDSKPVQDFIALLKARHTVIDPTLTTFDFIRQRDGELSQAYAPIADHLPLGVQRAMRVGILTIPDDATAARYGKSYQKMIEFVGRLYRAGVPLVAGTDEYAGLALQRELQLYVQAGLTPAQALQVATWNGATYSRTLFDRGSITPGKRADLVLIDGDPTRDITDVRKVALVITQGELIVPAQIDREFGIVPFVPDAPTLRDPEPEPGGM